ncbi:hypothetical protein SOCE26_074040 [Sorangium cellulosum]|uniref:Uncharacterized protein n=1 Tax=Sorangium cellulosum TaxID=56 RepID=A0A2L0F2U9_SORCE|nr:hypothetical protein [Sorangium cellulosum]AUX45904.1 hypothetical protein SOCE26_074040 [Sorangium cellulosum]
MGVTRETLAMLYPRLYHMAEAGSWPGIMRHGLLSTSALLDLFEFHGPKRDAIESAHRPKSLTITHPVHGRAVIRDQKPMSDKALLRALGGSLSPTEWYRLLNGMVFFWLTEKRLKRLLEAVEYRDKGQTVLTIDTARLLERHEHRVRLSPMNSGNTRPYPHPRGRDTFLPLSEYPFESRRKRGLEPAVELTVEYSVPDIRDVVLHVEETPRRTGRRVGAGRHGRV